MAEPLFGSGPQLWSTIPVPGFSYIPTVPGNRAVGGVSPSVIGTQPFTFATVPPSGPMTGNASPTDAGQSASGRWLAVGANPIGAGIPLLMPFDYATGATPHTLLAAIAIRRGQPMGPTNDQEIEDFISDALDLIPGANDVEVRCEGGRTTLTGSVPHKRVKRDIGEIVWAIPNVNDVQNNITIVARRRSRALGRDGETPAATAAGGRKQT